jgi:plasmid stability protein
MGVDMPKLTVRGISKDVYSVLKRDAKQHGRSLNAEILAALNDKVETARRRARAAEALKRLGILQARISRNYPGQPDSVALIWEDRDSR